MKQRVYKNYIPKILSYNTSHRTRQVQRNWVYLVQVIKINTL